MKALPIVSKRISEAGWSDMRVSLAGGRGSPAGNVLAERRVWSKMYVQIGLAASVDPVVREFA
jgi:hypothetical protein